MARQSSEDPDTKYRDKHKTTEHYRKAQRCIFMTLYLAKDPCTSHQNMDNKRKKVTRLHQNLKDQCVLLETQLRT